MGNDQQIIKSVTDEEISDIRNVIRKNQSDQDNTTWDHGEWHSSDGTSFQITKIVDNNDYVIEVTLDNVVVIGKLDELMESP